MFAVTQRFSLELSLLVPEARNVKAWDASPRL